MLYNIIRFKKRREIFFVRMQPLPGINVMDVTSGKNDPCCASTARMLLDLPKEGILK